MAAVIVAVLGSGAPAADAPKSDADALKELQGDWVGTHYEDRSGVEAVDPKKPHRLSVRGNRYTFVTVLDASKDLAQTDTGTLKVTTAKTPRHIDLEAKENSAIGIYELKGDQLTLCIVPKDSDRPTEFKVSGGATLLFKFKKAKK
jgi:uncharacterized protein (TIGR03067 family)